MEPPRRTSAELDSAAGPCRGTALPVRTFFTVNFFKGAPRRAGPSSPGRALSVGPRDHQGKCVNRRRCRAAGGRGGGGGGRRCGAAAWPAASSAAAHRRGPLPPRRSPAPAVRRPSPLRTLVTGPARAAGPSSSRRASCRRAKITVKGRARGHVACGDGANATVDTDLPRQIPAPIGEDARSSTHLLLTCPIAGVLTVLRGHLRVSRSAAELRGYWSCRALHSFPS